VGEVTLGVAMQQELAVTEDDDAARFRAMARAQAHEALGMLDQLSHDEDASMAQVAACHEVLDRAYGRAMVVEDGAQPGRGVTVVNVVTGLSRRVE
jgi:hypothetical protein